MIKLPRCPASQISAKTEGTSVIRKEEEMALGYEVCGAWPERAAALAWRERQAEASGGRSEPGPSHPAGGLRSV